MKKRGVQLATGLIFAGMVAMTGCGSAQTTGAEAPETTGVETEAPATEVAEPEAEAPAAELSVDTESVDVPMEENESALSGSTQTGTLTKFKNLKEVEQSVTKNQGYAYVNVQGANVSVIAVADSLDGRNTAESVTFYTKKSGEDKVYCAGKLAAHDPLQLTDRGIIIANSQHFTFETYFLSADGRSLEHKDYIEIDNGQGGKVIHSYRRSSNKVSNEYYNGTQQDFQKYYNDSVNVPEIVFTRGTK